MILVEKVRINYSLECQWGNILFLNNVSRFTIDRNDITAV